MKLKELNNVIMHTKEFKIGLFVVIVLTASFFIINYLRGEDIFNREIELYSTYDDVEGLVASAPVYIKGFKAGKVTEVEYMPDMDKFKVICSVGKQFRIPADSEMTIYSVDIMGGKGIRIDLGESESSVTDGAYLHSCFEAGLMDGLSSGITPLLEKAGTVIDSLNVTVSGINRILSKENSASIGRTLAHLESTMADINQIAAVVGNRSEELDTFVENLSSLSDKLIGIASSADTTLTGVNDFVSVLNASDIAGVVTSFRSLLEKINDPDGTIGKLMNDDSVYDSVDALLNDVDSLVRQIEENPKKYIKISIF